MSAPDIPFRLPAFTFPSYKSTLLSNGLKVFLVHDDTQELLSLSLIAKTGSTQETIEGQASVATAMLTRGTTTRSATKLAEDTDILGASLRSIGYRDTTGVAITGLSEHSDKLVQLIADCANNPSFDEDEFERLRLQCMSDHEYSLSDPHYLAHRCFAKLLYGKHPYSSSRTGTLASLSKLSAGNCVSYYDMVRSHSQWFAIVAGRFDEDVILRQLEQHFSHIRCSATAHSRIEVNVDNQLRTAYSVYEQAQQVILVAGQLCIRRDHPDYAALHLVNTVFGGYFLSRLNGILRETKGYTYGIFSSVDSMLHASKFSCACSLSAAHVEESIGIIHNEWKRLASERIDDGELRQAQNFILGSFARSMETPQQVAHFLASTEEYGLSPEYYEQFVLQVASLDPDSLRRVQQETVHPESLAFAAAGQEADLVPVLATVAPATRYEIE